MRSPILSIVVPIYKVEPYLRKCVDSLINQDLSSEEYEIILVDDGSPDKCGAIADAYATKSGNIKVIHQNNGGLSVARNTGIDAAKGKYIQFVDSDDYLEPNVIGALVERAERDNLDVLRFNYRNVNERYEEFWPNKTPKQTWGYEESVVDGVTFLNERLGYACYAVQFLIRTTLLADCKFKPGIYFEDVEWAPRMLLKAKRIASTKDVVYNYLFRHESITRTADLNKIRKKLDNQIFLIESHNILAINLKNKVWFKAMSASITLTILTQVTRHFYSERKTYIENLHNLKVSPLHLYKDNKRNWWKLILINISPDLYCFVMKIKLR